MLTDFGRWCDECNGTFTDDEWDYRHTSGEQDWHEGCCPECWGDPNECEFPTCGAQQAEGVYLCEYHAEWLAEARTTFEEAYEEAEVEKKSGVFVVDHGTHYTVESENGENLGAQVGHPRFITRAGADGWAESFRLADYDNGLR